MFPQPLPERSHLHGLPGRLLLRGGCCRETEMHMEKTVVTALLLPKELPQFQAGSMPLSRDGRRAADCSCSQVRAAPTPLTILFSPLQCVAGYHGVNCSEEINECLSHPCQNGGTCIDLINTYKCSCPRGTQGKLIPQAGTLVG